MNDLSQKLNNLYKCNRGEDYKLSGEELAEAERIYRFINNFSHECVFEETDETDLVFGELYDIVDRILSLIKRTDPDHYTAMIKSID